MAGESKINSAQVKFGGNFTLLKDYANKRWVKALPFIETQVLTAAGVQFKLISATILTGNIALGTASIYSGGVVAAALAGAVGTAATTSISDTLGNVANIVPIRSSTTHDPVLTAGGFEVFGLIQAASTATDGVAIAAAASENLQISFVYIAANGTVTLTAVTNTIEFAVNVMLTEANSPTYEVFAGAARPDVIDPTAATAKKVATYAVTTAFVANEIITLTTGAGATAGIATAGGDYAAISIEPNFGAFAANNNIEVLENGVEQIKQSDFVWDSATTGHFAIALDIGDTFKIKYYA